MSGAATARGDRAFRLTVAIVWALAGVGAQIYARMKDVPTSIAWAVTLAILVEAPFYLLPGFAAARRKLIENGRERAAGLMALGAVAGWLVFAVPTHHFRLPALILMISISLVMCFWYTMFPAGAVSDLLYLGVFALIILAKVFARIYPPTVPKVDLAALGHLMLIRMLAFSFTTLRGGTEAEYRFWPNGREWLQGLKWFAYLLPPVVAVYWALGLMSLREHPLGPGPVAGTFFGILWVTAISEEFIFRGLLQSWIEKWTGNWIAAVIASAVLFGSVHLGFHGTFPNWRFSLVTVVLGLFLAVARRRTGGIQAGMVAHSLLVAVWRMFLR